MLTSKVPVLIYICANCGRLSFSLHRYICFSFGLFGDRVSVCSSGWLGASLLPHLASSLWQSPCLSFSSARTTGTRHLPDFISIGMLSVAQEDEHFFPMH